MTSPFYCFLSGSVKLLNFLPAAGKQLVKCCACFGGGRRGTSEQRRGPAAARELVATRRTTEKKKGTGSLIRFIVQINQYCFGLKKISWWFWIHKTPAINMLQWGTRVFWLTAHLGKPREVVDNRGGAALDLHQRDLIFSCHQDVLLVVEHCGQVHTPNEMREAKLKHKYVLNTSESVLTLQCQ